MIITIDGPAASGKSSVAGELARQLNFYYLYTGILYRGVAYILSKKYKKQVSTATCFGPFKVSEHDLVFIKKLSYEYKNGRPKLFFEGRDISDNLDNTVIDQFSSFVSAHKGVRRVLLEVQRAVAKEYDVVADGRDCGSVVFPYADVKFYLTARLQVRAQRRLLDARKRGETVTFEQVKKELEERDHRDREREVAPLTIPEGAVVINNSCFLSMKNNTLNIFQFVSTSSKAQHRTSIRTMVS